MLQVNDALGARAESFRHKCNAFTCWVNWSRGLWCVIICRNMSAATIWVVKIGTTGLHSALSLCACVGCTKPHPTITCDLLINSSMQIIHPYANPLRGLLDDVTDSLQMCIYTKLHFRIRRDWMIDCIIRIKRDFFFEARDWRMNVSRSLQPCSVAVGLKIICNASSLRWSDDKHAL